MPESLTRLVLTIPLPPRPQPRPRCACIPDFSKGKCLTCGQPRAGTHARAHSGAHGGKKRKGQADRDASEDDPLAIFAQWKKDVTFLLREHWRGQPRINGPIRARFVFVVPRPKSRPTVSVSTTETVRGITRKIPNPRLDGGHWIVSKESWLAGQRVPCPVKPDRDRYLNALQDALTDAGIWWDDAQVCGGETQKFYAALGEEPSIYMRVEPW